MNEARASVIIRTWNARELVERTVCAVRAQTPAFPFEIVCVDSGSTDGTREFLHELEKSDGIPPLRVIDIPSSEFTYGGSLNTGAHAARAEILVLLSQDATPTDADWLGHLVDPLLTDPTLCATFGRQSPRDDANPVEAHDLRYVYHDRPLRFDSEPPFSSANGALRRGLWEPTPFDEELPFAEDRAWAQIQAQNGFVVAYVPLANVLHSHGYDLGGVYRRCIEEHSALARMGNPGPSWPQQCKTWIRNLRAHGAMLIRDRRLGFHAYAMVYRATQLTGAWNGHRRGKNEMKTNGA